MDEYVLCVHSTHILDTTVHARTLSLDPIVTVCRLYVIRSEWLTLYSVCHQSDQQTLLHIKANTRNPILKSFQHLKLQKRNAGSCTCTGACLKSHRPQPSVAALVQMGWGGGGHGAGGWWWGGGDLAKGAWGNVRT